MADISRDMYDEQKRYALSIVQRGIPWVDADENDRSMGMYNAARRFIQFAAGDGYPAVDPTSFQVVEATSTTNNFEITGGGGDAVTAARFWAGGHQCLLYNPIDYVNTASDLDESSICPRSSAVTATVLTDASANWVTNELAGRTLYPLASSGTGFTIATNTATAITITAGDMTAVAAAKDPYRIALTTPGGSPRTDGVYLNVHLREVDAVEDPNLVHTLTGSVVAQLRRTIQQTIFVREDVATHGEFASYTDTEGWRHEVVKLATVVRPASTAAILTAHITDTRSVISFTDQLVKVSATDTTPDYLVNKLASGAGIDVSKTGSGDEDATIKVDDLSWASPEIETDAALKGAIPAWDTATGAPTTIAPSTAGYVLTDNGASTLPSFQAAAGGSPAVDEMKNATVVASGSIAASVGATWTRVEIALDTINAHRFYWGSCLAYPRSSFPSEVMSVNHFAGVRGTTDGGGTVLAPSHRYIIEYFGSGGTASVSYKVYRIDET